MTKSADNDDQFIVNCLANTVKTVRRGKLCGSGVSYARWPSECRRYEIDSLEFRRLHPPPLQLPLTHIR